MRLFSAWIAFFVVIFFIQDALAQDGMLLVLFTLITSEKESGSSLNAHLRNWPSSLENQTNHSEVFSNGPTCENAEKEAVTVSNAIRKVVTFYEKNLESLTSGNDIVGLKTLKGMRNKDYFQVEDLFNRTEHLINAITEHLKKGKSSEIQKAFSTIEKADRIFARPEFSEWAPLQKLQNLKTTFGPVGNDENTIWGPLNGYCQVALITKCDVPYVCEKTFLDPECQSQYMLSHQAFYLHFAKMQKCDILRPTLFKNLEEINRRHAAKMLLEAEFLARNNFPDWGRDLFSEYVFVGGLIGYPNFLREDWINTILSWQSKSEEGCFVNHGNVKYNTSEVSVPLKAAEGQEDCLLHFTATSLSALAMKMDWLQENCLKTSAPIPRPPPKCPPRPGPCSNIVSPCDPKVFPCRCTGLGEICCVDNKDCSWFCVK